MHRSTILKSSVSPEPGCHPIGPRHLDSFPRTNSGVVSGATGQSPVGAGLDRYQPRYLSVSHGLLLALCTGSALTLSQTNAPLVTPEIIPFEDAGDENQVEEAELGFGLESPELADDASPGEPLDHALPGIDPLESLAIPDDEFGTIPFEGDEQPQPDQEMEAPDSDEAWAVEETATVQDVWDDPGGLWFSYEPGLTAGWPTGFDDFWGGGFAGMEGTMLGAVREGLSMGVSLGGSYDTNVSQRIASLGGGSQGDFITTLGGNVSYRSIAPVWTFGFRYSGSYRWYADRSALNGYNQNAGSSLHYNSGPLSATLNLGLNFGSGANRLSGTVLDEIRYNYGVNARYRISPKTSVAGNFSQRLTDASGGIDTNSFNAGLSAYWHYSPLLDFGPGIRYTRRVGDSGPRRTSIGPTLSANYQLSQKVRLNSRVGVDFASYSDGGSTDPSFSTSVGMSYQINEFSSMSLNLLRDVQASQRRAGEFEEMTAVRLGYNRRIQRVSWSVGTGFENRKSRNATPGLARRSDRNYFTADTSLGTQVFTERTRASVFARYRNQSGGIDESWGSLNIGFNISHSF